MKVYIIAAKTVNNVIGANGRQPWDIPDDWKYFQKLTFGHFVILGRITNNTMPRSITNNWTKLLISKSLVNSSDAITFESFDKSIDYCLQNNIEEVFVLGGQDIFKNALNIADKIYLTIIEKELDGDRFFPDLDLKKWSKVFESDRFLTKDNAFKYYFTEWERVQISSL